MHRFFLAAHESDWRAANVGALATYGLANTGALFWLGIPLAGLWGLAGPTAQAMMTRSVGEDEQGQLQGASSSLVGISSPGGPILFTTIFAFGIERATPGAPFLTASLLLFGGILFAWHATKPVS